MFFHVSSSNRELLTVPFQIATMVLFISLVLVPLPVVAEGGECDTAGMLQSVVSQQKIVASAGLSGLRSVDVPEWIPTDASVIIFGKDGEKCNGVGRPIKSEKGCEVDAGVLNTTHRHPITFHVKSEANRPKGCYIFKP